jgi:hypothetical protein
MGGKYPLHPHIWGVNRVCYRCYRCYRFFGDTPPYSFSREWSMETEARKRIDPKEVEALLRLLARILLRLLGEERDTQEVQSNT